MTDIRMRIDSAIAFVASNRRAVLIAAALCLFFFSSLYAVQSAESRLSKKRAALDAFNRMKAEYVSGLSGIGGLRDRLGATGKTGSAFEAVQAVATETALRGNISQLKPYDPRPMAGYRQSGVEIVMEGVDIGQAVNFLQGLEESGQLLLTEEFSMNASFESPDRLDVKARVRLVSRQ